MLTVIFLPDGGEFIIENVEQVDTRPVLFNDIPAVEYLLIFDKKRYLAEAVGGITLFNGEFPELAFNVEINRMDGDNSVFVTTNHTCLITKQNKK